MLFHTTNIPKAGLTHEDRKIVLKLWANFQPPEGFEIKSFNIAADGRGFGLIEAASAEAIYEALSLWADVYINYEIVPVMEADKAIDIENKAIAIRESI